MGAQTAMQLVFIDLDSDEEAHDLTDRAFPPKTGGSASDVFTHVASQAAFKDPSEDDDELSVLDIDQYKEHQLQKHRATTIEQNKHAFAAATSTFASIAARMKLAQDTAKALPSQRNRSSRDTVARAHATFAPAAEANGSQRKPTEPKTERLEEKVRGEQMLAPGACSPPAPAAERDNNGTTEHRKNKGAATVKSGQGTLGEKRKKRKRKPNDDEWLPGDEEDSEPDAHPGEKRTTRAKARGGPSTARKNEQGAGEEERQPVAENKQLAAQEANSDNCAGRSPLQISIEAAVAAVVAQALGVPPAAAPPRTKGKAAASAVTAGAVARVPKPRKKAPARKAAATPVFMPHVPRTHTGPSEKTILEATKKMFAALDKRVAFLPKGDSEHKKVMTLLASTEVPIVAIHKVLNGSARLAAFEEEARALPQVRPGGANVQQCWHGTSVDALLSILKTGFTASRTVHGKSHGNGLYMAPSNGAATSMRYARAGDLGVSHMFLLRVILGAVEQGRGGMDLPSNPDLYDSAANNVHTPSEIIVWTPYLFSRILIEYVICFRSGDWF